MYLTINKLMDVNISLHLIHQVGARRSNLRLDPTICKQAFDDGSCCDQIQRSGSFLNGWEMNLPVVENQFYISYGQILLPA
jgi:hypothetical protein